MRSLDNGQVYKKTVFPTLSLASSYHNTKEVLSKYYKENETKRFIRSIDYRRGNANEKLPY